eukprot:CAMPEP_0179457938 /NCGR_PEP_ID=MMETSP0799-20121207/41586_1 /TAXON_ID=46947 /ORGANISM="Geminigera cryophila, Strain CCMP2564" /LENGTH=120 /DNA_ID=CAMNT_0021258885 /DNA_START=178 /DNA_END=538 /DNA_ORIENTATION=-
MTRLKSTDDKMDISAPSTSKMKKLICVTPEFPKWSSAADIAQPEASSDAVPTSETDLAGTGKMIACALAPKTRRCPILLSSTQSVGAANVPNVRLAPPRRLLHALQSDLAAYEATYGMTW